MSSVGGGWVEEWPVVGLRMHVFEQGSDAASMSSLSGSTGAGLQARRHSCSA